MVWLSGGGGGVVMVWWCGDVWLGFSYLSADVTLVRVIRNGWGG